MGNEHVLEAVQRRLDEHPEKMRQRRQTVEHPFGTMKARMGATHFLMKTLQAMRSADETRESVPVTGDAERPLPTARRNVAGRTKR